MHNFQRFLLATIAVSVVFLAQKVIIQGLAVNHHRKQYETRIRDIETMVRSLTILYKRSIELFPKFDVFADLDRAIEDRWETSKLAPAIKSRSLNRVSDGAWSVFNTVLSEVSGGKKVDEDSATVMAALERSGTARALATRLWRFLTENSNDDFNPDDILKCGDFEKHFPSAQQQQAQDIFKYLVRFTDA